MTGEGLVWVVGQKSKRWGQWRQLKRLDIQSVGVLL